MTTGTGSVEETSAPLPAPPYNADAQRFWDGIARGQLLGHACTACGKLALYPTRLCKVCLGEQFDTQPLSGRGTVYSCTVIHRAPLPALAAKVPYVVALVDLDEGVRMLAQVEGPPGNVAVGARVAIAFRPASPRHTLPVFVLTAPAEA